VKGVTDVKKSKGGGMAKRLISALIAVPIGIFILWVDRKELLLLVCAALSAAMVYEILLATKYLQNAVITVYSLVFVLTFPFILNYDYFFLKMRYVSFAFIIGLFVIMLFSHKKVSMSEVALVAFVSVCIPFSLSSMGLMFNHFPLHRTFCLVYALTVTWIGDAGAYFVGTLIGRHKMSPDISPKKTWEGFAGGLITAAVFGALIAKGYEMWEYVFTGRHTFTTDLPYLSVLAVVCSVFGVLGDLSASLLKRECSVKDFGSIMPGHGGVLDRFDSVLFALPLVYLAFLRHFPVTDIKL